MPRQNQAATTAFDMILTFSDGSVYYCRKLGRDEDAIVGIKKSIVVGHAGVRYLVDFGKKYTQPKAITSGTKAKSKKKKGKK